MANHCHLEVDMDPPTSSTPRTEPVCLDDGSVCLEIDAEHLDIHLSFASLQYLVEWIDGISATATNELAAQQRERAANPVPHIPFQRGGAA